MVVNLHHEAAYLVTLAFEQPACREYAEDLAKQLGLPINQPASMQLEVTLQGLYLHCPPFSPIQADFNLTTWQHRRNAGKQQGIVRACKPHPGIHIIDATAGWGRDAAILASFGADVLMLERNPIMSVLLQDALTRRDSNSVQNMKLHTMMTDAQDYLQNLPSGDYPDVIYLDPMHPTREGTALVKKDMQILQQLIGFDEQVKDLLTLATQRVKNRVVLKWPTVHKPVLPPTFSISGKTVRFDIYLRQNIYHP